MALYNAKGGTLTGPFGTIKINQLNCSITYLDYRNTTGPGDSGNSTFDKGNKVYGIGLTGVLQDTDNNETIGDATFDDPVAVVLQFGSNAEKWAGNLEVQSVQTRSDFENGGNIRVSLSGRFTGAVVVTDGVSVA